jgi:hypothetical protein
MLTCEEVEDATQADGGTLTFARGAIQWRIGAVVYRDVQGYDVHTSQSDRTSARLFLGYTPRIAIGRAGGTRRRHSLCPSVSECKTGR